MKNEPIDFLGSPIAVGDTVVWTETDGRCLGSMQLNREVESHLSDAVYKLTMAGPHMLVDGFFNGPELHGKRKASGEEGQENGLD